MCVNLFDGRGAGTPLPFSHVTLGGYESAAHAADGQDHHLGDRTAGQPEVRETEGRVQPGGARRSGPEGRPRHAGSQLADVLPPREGRHHGGNRCAQHLGHPHPEDRRDEEDPRNDGGDHPPDERDQGQEAEAAVQAARGGSESHAVVRRL